MDILETHAYDSRLRRNASCVLFLGLLPFFLSAAAYLQLWLPDPSPSVVSAAAKSAPVIYLALVVLYRNGLGSLVGVAGGLLFSAGGDICLIWPELFLHGMGSFAVAHLLYSLCFLSERYTYLSSSSSLFYVLYLLLLLLVGGVYANLLPYLQNVPDAGIITPAVGVYVLLIVVMAMLALRTRRPLTLMGSLVFMISDLCLALQHFGVIPPQEYGQHVVMVTYYLAQLLIAIGDVRAKENDEFRKWKRS
ncbi:lysoplasmalogenase [Clupea harengus]|uniref:lysoplasmalogenase n=1 Tax=Clupea harengus TaxID=7950 RepID=A0A6P3VPS6_CLUHA|nr:lysoplasmalogenase [Clupea harengus]